MSEKVDVVGLLYPHALRGPNTDYYVKRFRELDEGLPGLHQSWNWAAFFFTWVWAIYRRQYLLAAAVLIFGAFVNWMVRQNANALAVIFLVSGWYCFGAYANALYRDSIRRHIEFRQARDKEPETLLRLLRKRPATIGWIRYIGMAYLALAAAALVGIPILIAEQKGFDWSGFWKTPDTTLVVGPNIYAQFDDPPRATVHQVSSCGDKQCTDVAGRRYNLVRGTTYLTDDLFACSRAGFQIVCEPTPCTSKKAVVICPQSSR